MRFQILEGPAEAAEAADLVGGTVDLEQSQLRQIFESLLEETNAKIEVFESRRITFDRMTAQKSSRHLESCPKLAKIIGVDMHNLVQLFCCCLSQPPVVG